MRALAIILCLGTCSAHAQDLILKKVNETRTKLIMDFGQKPPDVGAEFIYKDEFDEPCIGKVVKVTSTALVEISNCELAKNLKGGEKFSLSSAPTPASPPVIETPAPISEPKPTPVIEEQKTFPAAVDSGNKVQVSGRLFYSFAETAKFDSLTLTDNTGVYTGSAEYNSQAVWGVGVDIGAAPKNAWGWSSGLDYDSIRYLDSVKISGANGSATVTYTSPKPSLTLLTLFGNVIYRWNEVYLPFGFNYLISPTFKQGAGASGTTSVKGGFGAQIGIGFHATDRVALELHTRSLALSIDARDGVTHLDLGTGYLSGLHFILKLKFN